MWLPPEIGAGQRREKNLFANSNCLQSVSQLFALEDCDKYNVRVIAQVRDFSCLDRTFDEMTLESKENRINSCWLGGLAMSSLTSFPKMVIRCCVRCRICAFSLFFRGEDYTETGPRVSNWLCN